MPTFAPPALTSSARHIRYPTYTEWNLELEQALGNKSSFSIDYVGKDSHGQKTIKIKDTDKDIAFVKKGMAQ